MLPPSGLLSGRYGGNTTYPYIVGLIDIPAELVYRLIKTLGIIDIIQIAFVHIQHIPRLERNVLLEVPCLNLLERLILGKDELGRHIFVLGNLVEKVAQSAGCIKLEHDRSFLERIGSGGEILCVRDIPAEYITILRGELCLFRQQTLLLHPAFIPATQLLYRLFAQRLGIRKGSVVPLAGAEKEKQPKFSAVCIGTHIAQIFVFPAGGAPESQTFQIFEPIFYLFQIVFV